MLQEILSRMGEPWCYNHLYDFGLEDAEAVADFYNNGGLEFHRNGWYYALQYAALCNGKVEIGAWVWEDGEDFDEDATFEVYEEIDFSVKERKMITEKIKSIYGKAND